MTNSQQTVLNLLQSDPRRGFHLGEIANALGSSEQGAARTTASLVRHGFAIRFIGGIYPRRTYFQVASGAQVASR